MGPFFFHANAIQITIVVIRSAAKIPLSRRAMQITSKERVPIREIAPGSGSRPNQSMRLHCALYLLPFHGNNE